MDNKKKTLTQTELIIVSTAGSFGGINLIYTLMLEIAFVFIRPFVMLLLGISGSIEGMAEVDQIIFRESMKTLAFCVVYLIFTTFAFIFVFKSKLGIPTIILGIISTVIWLNDLISTAMKGSFNFVFAIHVFAVIALVICIYACIKKFIISKRDKNLDENMSSQNI